MTVDELIAKLRTKSLNGMGNYKVKWMNLKIEEYVDIEGLDINDDEESILLR